MSQRLLPALQLTRMALVFTAIADAQTTLLLRARLAAGPGNSIAPYLDARLMVAVAIISVGMYAFGMSLNDIIDRRRDAQLASHRPLPSGRIGLGGAYAICILMGLAALLAGIYYAGRSASGGWLSIAVLVWTGALIAMYDFAGKYLVAAGLLILGFIRFFHAAIPVPRLPLLWHPLLLLNHVTLLSTVCYLWEQKRPALTRSHWMAVLGGLAAVDLIAIGAFCLRGVDLWITPDLALPLGAAGAFVLVAWQVKRRSPTPQLAGQTTMLYGLLWLIVYDALFVAGYVGAWAGALVLLLLPVAYVAVKLMRWWSKLMLLSQRPAYRRV